MSTTLRTRRRLLAVTVAATPVVIATGNAVFPKDSFQFTGTTQKALTGLAATAASPDRVRAASLILIVGVVMLAVSFCAIASLVRSRGGRTATAGAVLGVVGCVGAILVVAWLGLSFYAASQAQIPDDAKATYIVSLLKDTGLGNIAGFPFLAGLIGGSVLMGIALFRSGRVARWIAIVFPVGVIAALVFAPQGLPALVTALPLIVVMPLLAREIRRDGDLNPSVANDAPTADRVPAGT